MGILLRKFVLLFLNGNVSKEIISMQCLNVDLLQPNHIKAVVNNRVDMVFVVVSDVLMF